MKSDRRQDSLSISWHVFDDLRRAILSGQFAPGVRLPGERALAEQYQTNRNTLREAVRRLEYARLIEVRQGHGATVTDFRRSGTPELLLPYLQAQPPMAEVVRAVEDLLEPRTLIMSEVVRLAVQRAEGKDLELLRALGEELQQFFAAWDVSSLVRGHWVWVERLVDAAHSISLRWLANSLFEALRGVQEHYPDWWVIEPSFSTYLASTLAAFESRNEAAALRATRQYYKTADEHLLFLLRAFAGVDGEGLTAKAGSPASR